jgi:hypothetical protein
LDVERKEVVPVKAEREKPESHVERLFTAIVEAFPLLMVFFDRTLTAIYLHVSVCRHFSSPCA